MEQLHHHQGGEIQGGPIVMMPRIYEHFAESPHGQPTFCEIGQLEFDFSESCEPIPETEGLASPEEIRMTRSLLGAIVQVLDGRRRLLTIEPALSLNVRESLKTRLRYGSSRTEARRLLGAHIYKPTKGVIEACGTIAHGRRAQALVARLERCRQAWECVLLRVIE